MVDNLNILLCATKLAFLVSLAREDSFESQTHKRGQKGLIEIHIKE